MSGPCSFPAGSKSEWESHSELVCEFHSGNFWCTPDRMVRGFDKKSGEYYELNHEFVTRRRYLAKRNKLRTGKTK